MLYNSFDRWFSEQYPTDHATLTNPAYKGTEWLKLTKLKRESLHDAFYAGIERGITIEKQRHITAITNAPNLEKLKEMKELLD